MSREVARALGARISGTAVGHDNGLEPAHSGRIVTRSLGKLDQFLLHLHRLGNGIRVTFYIASIGRGSDRVLTSLRVEFAGLPQRLTPHFGRVIACGDTFELARRTDAIS